MRSSLGTLKKKVDAAPCLQQSQRYVGLHPETRADHKERLAGFQECSQWEDLLTTLQSLGFLPQPLTFSFPLSPYRTSYSALKKDGQRLSTLMKRGKAVEARPARPVTVHSISLLEFQPPFFTLGEMGDSLLCLHLRFVFG